MPPTSPNPSPASQQHKSHLPKASYVSQSTHSAAHTLSVLHLNARSLFPKRSELHTICTTIHPDIVAVTETWLDPTIPDGSFLPPGYCSAYRADREARIGGGVILMCRDDLPFLPRPDLCCWSESAWIELHRSHSSNGRSFIIGCYYRPPKNNYTAIDDFVVSMETTFDRINLARTDVVLVGDFNATSSSWCTEDSTSVSGRLLDQYFLGLGLHQCVASRTHLDPSGCLTSLLDLVLVSHAQMVTSVDTLPPLANSDHLSVLTTFNLAFRRTSSTGTRQVWCYSKGDFKTLNSVLQTVDWSPIMTAPDVDSGWTAWLGIFLPLVRRYVPSKFLKHVKRKLPWMTPAIEREIKQKRSFFRSFKRHPTLNNRSAFISQRNKVTHLLRKAERAHSLQSYRNIGPSTPSSSSCPDFWSYMKSLSGKSHRPSMPDLRAPPPSNQLYTSPQDKATALNKFFADQTILPERQAVPNVADLPFRADELSSLSTTPADVYDVLSSLSVQKAAGLDGISPRLLKLCSTGIASSLASLFNRSFSEGNFPSSWKSALVIPVFKRGDRSSLTNYRPISLLSCVGKVCERLVYTHLYQYLSPNLSANQSGFRRQDGTSNQLTRLVQLWSEALDDSQYVGALFFDLRKAFDRVWHRGLLAKLYAAGVRGSLHRWFVNYLSGRQQRTRIGCAVSSSLSLSAGVPQGAILSPLLFILYVNDIITATPASVNLFADDTSAVVMDSCPTSLEVRLQHTLTSLSDWFDRWLLAVNPVKSAVVIFHTRGMPPLEVHVQINGEEIPQVNFHKHLGLTLNSHLTWDCHVDTILRKASQRLGVLRRYRRRLSPLVIRFYYITAIRPLLEYASNVWSGLSNRSHEALERFQRRAARLIIGVAPRSELPHAIILARAGFATLHSRRRLQQAIFVYKFLNRALPEHVLDSLQHWPSAKSDRALSLRNAAHLLLPRPKKNVLSSSPLYIAFSTWNNLPSDIRCAKTLSSLRSLLTSDVVA